MSLEALTASLQALKESSAAFPPLHSASGGLLAVMDTLQQDALHGEEVEYLTQKVKSIKATIDRHEKEPMPSSLSRRLDEIGREISQEVDGILNHGADITTLFHKVAFLIEGFDVEHNSDKTLSRYGTVNVVGHDQFNVTTNYYASPSLDANDIFSHILFNNLSHVAKASYDASTPAQRRGCTENTRTAIIIKLWEWASDPLQPKIYWMKGMAGTGKTTISYSLSLRLESANMLGATFFCSRLVDECAKVDRIFPTIAYGLARNVPPLAPAILGALKKDPDVAHKTLNQQFTNLIVNPIAASSGELAGKSIVIIIDALDECGSQKDVQALLSVIFNRSRQLPFKIFITSRPEQAIRTEFNRRRPETYSEFILHDVEQDIVNADIKLYIAERFVDMAEGRSDFDGCSDDWPPEEKIDVLATRANRLFIFAKTVCDYIGEHGGNISERLAEAASMEEIRERNSVLNDAAGTRELDALYRDILQRAIPLRKKDYDRQKVVLSAVISIRNPLSACGLGTLLNIDSGVIKSSLSSLHSVMSVPQSVHAPVSTFHASFPDFLTDTNRSREHFLCSSNSHRQLAARCLLLMNSCLRENICGLDGRPANDGIAKESIATHIPEGLGYACLFWVSHLIVMEKEDVHNSDEIFTLLDEFFREHVLHWIECLSLLRQLSTAIESLRRLEGWVLGIYPEMLGMITDAHRFVTENFDVIRHYCLETYHSALVWVPTLSFIRERFGCQRPDLPKVVIGFRKTWGACQNVIICPAEVWSVALTSGGSRIVCGSRKTVQVWDTATGAVETEFEGHLDSIFSVAVSSDDNRIASCSADKTVRIWNKVTGEMERVFEGHSDRVNSVAFSSDGSRVVSGSSDATIRIWNVLTGELESILEGCLDAVFSAVFSVDGSRIASGSVDGSIRIWNVATGKIERTLEGHSDEVISVAFSSDGSHIVSGSYDTTARIWNALTGKMERVLEGHSRLVQSVVFSRDGTRVVSGSSDRTIRIWNAATGGLVCVLEGHTSSVDSVAIFEDGSRVVSGSRDCTVRVWSVTGELDRAPGGHSSWVISIVFSNDGSRMASGSFDNTVRIWNARTGEVERVLEGHSGYVSSVAFSSDGSRVVSGSFDKIVRIWNTASGALERVLKSPSDRVILSDGSDIRCEHDGQFRVSFAAQDQQADIPPSCRLSDDSWILSDTGQRCWLPPKYRDYHQVNSYGSKVSFDYFSGLIVVLDMNPSVGDQQLDLPSQTQMCTPLATHWHGRHFLASKDFLH